MGLIGLVHLFCIRALRFLAIGHSLQSCHSLALSSLAHPWCTRLSTHSAPVSLQLDETGVRHTVVMTHLRFVIITLEQVPDTSHQSCCIVLVHSLSHTSGQPFHLYLLLFPQTSCTSSPTPLSADDFASHFNSMMGAIRREFPPGLVSISSPYLLVTHVLCPLFYNCTNGICSHLGLTPLLVY